MKDEKSKLNPEQLAAVTHTIGPLLIVAGAGTGKTTVLIERLAYLIKEKLAKPDEILITTFTEKAAGEMEERADKILPYGYVDLWINTFHGLCERILKDHALDIGLPGNFKVLDQTEQWVLIRRNLDLFDLDYYRPLGNPSKFIHELLKHFSRLKDENITAEEYLEYADGLRQDFDAMLSGIKNPKSKIQISNKAQNSPASQSEYAGSRQPRDKKGREKLKNLDLIKNFPPEADPPMAEKLKIKNSVDNLEVKRINELAGAYHIYNQLLLDNGFLDFGDLICYTIKLFKERPNILAYYHSKFKYILVDEFQDTNWAQYELIKILSRPENNLTVVGDDDQAIYRFRGASMSNIMQFKDDFSDAREIVLIENYRSYQTILDRAYEFIKHNDPNRLEVKLGIEKKLNAKRKGTGMVEHLHYAHDKDETAGVAQKILELKEQGKGDVKWSDFAILVRANDTADKFVAELTALGIPNQFVSMRGLYLKPMIIDIVSYLRLLDNYHESTALFRVLNMESFKVSHQDIIAINKFGRAKLWSLFETLQNIRAVPGIGPEAQANIGKLLRLIEKHSAMAGKDKPSRIYIDFLNESGVLTHLDHDRDREVFENLNQFYRKIISYEEALPNLRLKEFIELLALEQDSGETGALNYDAQDAETVKIMTVHAAKGLEFDHVFIVNLVDKRFPTISRSEKISIPDALVREKLPEGDTHIEEERRLFYVAMTRARGKLYLTSAEDYGGAREKKVSKFIEEAGVKISEPARSSLPRFDQLSQKISEEEIEIKRGALPLPVSFSFSQIEAYTNCPLQYKFAFLLKIPVGEKANFVFGRTMHSVLRDFFLPVITSPVSQSALFAEAPADKKALLNEKNLEEILSRLWQDYGYANKTEKDNYRKKAKNSLKLFYEKYEKEGWPEVMHLEKNFNLKIAGRFFKGAIDRVDRISGDKVAIIDYKTGNPKEKLDFDSKKQLILYQMALEELFGYGVARLSYFYLENGEELSFETKPAEKEKLLEGIEKTIQQIEKRNFLPKPGPLCAYCDFKGICEFRK